uniref:Uncharacterized protein n=1 Tax=Musca domestica TaxID=7370 RepID=A0A1I8NL29_MUSDO
MLPILYLTIISLLIMPLQSFQRPAFPYPPYVTPLPFEIMPTFSDVGPSTYTVPDIQIPYYYYPQYSQKMRIWPYVIDSYNDNTDLQIQYPYVQPQQNWYLGKK